MSAVELEQRVARIERFLRLDIRTGLWRCDECGRYTYSEEDRPPLEPHPREGGYGSLRHRCRGRFYLSALYLKRAGDFT